VAEPYIAELQTARWTSDQIRHAFSAAGFEVRDWPLTQHLEKQVPADLIFFSPSFAKLFGLQYKAAYRNGQDFWQLDRQQHDTLQRYKWIFYCCSELKEVSDHSMALYFARLYRPRFEFQPRLASSSMFREGGRPYVRWGAFYRGLKACRLGAKVESNDHLRDLLGPLSGSARLRESMQMTEFFLADFDKRIVLADRTF
jgi:hypothetical protein